MSSFGVLDERSQGERTIQFIEPLDLFQDEPEVPISSLDLKLIIKRAFIFRLQKPSNVSAIQEAIVSNEDILVPQKQIAKVLYKYRKYDFTFSTELHYTDRTGGTGGTGGWRGDKHIETLWYLKY